MSQLQLPSFLGEVLSKANDFVPSAAGSILMDRPVERGETPSDTALYFIATFGRSSSGLSARVFARIVVWWVMSIVRASRT